MPDPTRQHQWDADTLVARYDEVRAHTEALAAPLSPEDQTVQSMPDVSPTKWHRAHVTWFFETFVLADHEPSFTPYQDQYWFLFNSYYEGVGPRYARAERGFITRPAPTTSASTAPTSTPACATSSTTLDGGSLEKLAVDHRARLPPRAAAPGAAAHGHQARAVGQPAPAGVCRHGPVAPSAPDPLGWVDVEGGLVEVGHRGGGFSFDNELPLHQQWLEPYRLADRLVTNGEWLEFMADRGYERHELWLSDGWARVRGRGLAGAVLLARGRRRVVRAHAERHPPGRPGPAGEPRQPLRGRRVRHVGRQAAAHRGRVGARRRRRRAGRARRPPAATSPTPRRSTPARPARPTGHLRQVYGDCWEWTSSAYLAYPGYHPPAGAIGEYNGKFMSGQMVLRGGCALTPPGSCPGDATATSSRRARAGRCPASASPTAVVRSMTAREPVVTVAARPRLGLRERSSTTCAAGSARSRARCRRSGSTTTSAPTSSTRSPGCRSTTRPSASGRSCATTPPTSSTAVRRDDRRRARQRHERQDPHPARRVRRRRQPRALRAGRRLRADAARRRRRCCPSATRRCEVEALVGDFTLHLGHLPRGGRRLVAFLGGTIGNFYVEERAAFLGALARQPRAG